MGAKLIKYPSLYTVKEFIDLIRKIPELLDMNAYVEPKYDGSNITVVDGEFRTRNLNPLPKNFMEGTRIALGNKYSALIELSKKCQVFFELGGIKNAPAGYTDSWESNWDYRIFDLILGSNFLHPEKVEELCSRYGLKFVGYEIIPVRTIVEEWQKHLSRYKSYEGFVVKIFPSQSILKKIPYHRQYNVVVAKIKHEYLGVKVAQVKKKPKEKKIKVEEEPELPLSEVMGAINKAHLQLGEEIFDKKKAMPLIFKLVKEEAEKHKFKPPKAGKLFKYYTEYLENIKKK